MCDTEQHVADVLAGASLPVPDGRDQPCLPVGPLPKTATPYVHTRHLGHASVRRLLDVKICDMQSR